jgi:hypothetical protein
VLWGTPQEEAKQEETTQEVQETKEELKGELKKELKEAQEEANNELVVLVAGKGDKKTGDSAAAGGGTGAGDSLPCGNLEFRV